MTLAPPPVERLHGLTADEYALAVEALGRVPNDVELGMFGAMWSEHCAYKHSRPLLGPAAEGRGLACWSGRARMPAPSTSATAWRSSSRSSRTTTRARSSPTRERPPGVGGIIRDIFTMGARPIALLNSLRFGPLEPDGRTDAPTAARNRYLFGGVVAGIAGYGNCIGIPDVGGEVIFDATYSGNPLVNAMCVGIARHDEITLARAAGTGNVLLLVGASTGRDGIQGASFASATLGEDREQRRPAVQVGNPFLEKLLMEACLELAGLDGVVAMQDLGAAGLTCALAELTARGGVGAEVDLDAVPRRETGMTPYEVLLSESQERMLIVVRPDASTRCSGSSRATSCRRRRSARSPTSRLIRCHAAGELVCEIAGRALADDAPRYRHLTASRRRSGAGRISSRSRPSRPAHRSCSSSSDRPNARDRKPIWRRYDHMNGTNTVVGPGAGDAALLR